MRHTVNPTSSEAKKKKKRRGERGASGSPPLATERSAADLPSYRRPAKATAAAQENGGTLHPMARTSVHAGPDGSEPLPGPPGEECRAGATLSFQR